MRSIVLGLVLSGCGGVLGGDDAGLRDSSVGTDAPGALSVRITTPAAGSMVSGTVHIEATATAAVSVEFSIDGVAALTDSSSPFAYEWGSTAHANPLPPTTHAMDYGYYFTDGRYGDLRAEVEGYTNLYYAWAWRNYPTDAPWGDAFSASMAAAEASGRRIHLNIQEPGYYAEALDRAAPHWAAVRRIEMADEPGWTRAETEGYIASLRADLAARGLSAPPIGIVYTAGQVLGEDGIFSDGLDWVGIEAYVDPPGSGDSATDIATLVSYVNEAKARVPPDRDLVIVMMAYDRNGSWTNLSTLYDLQLATYDLVRDDPRVLAVTMFSYGRPGGTHDHPELRTAHALMAERILGISVPWLANGPHTISVVARDAAGGTATDSISVVVAN